MKSFNEFKLAVDKQMQKVTSAKYVFDGGASKEELWHTYLQSFPEGTNLIYITNTEHDCNCCKQFIRAAGNMIAEINGELVSIWDIEGEGHYKVVADALSALVKSSGIAGLYLHDVEKVGVDKSKQQTDKGEIVWDHFYFKLPKKLFSLKGDVASIKGSTSTNKQVLERSVNEITSDSIEVVLDLIAQNSLYRGEEFKSTLTLLQELKVGLASANNKDLYLWCKAIDLGSVSSIRNTVIGTLLADISNGVELEDAVKMFESKVAPTNYKRPTALITQKMIDNAQKKVQELGIEDSLSRCHAKESDITINNVLFADRSVKKNKGIFEELSSNVKTDTKKFEKVEEVPYEKFVGEVLPRATAIEVLLENKHTGNLMTLVAPENKEAKGIFKWKNNFSWTYNGDVTDSIKERVKAAGGKVDGFMRVSLAWFNSDDLDIHVVEPNGHRIFYRNRQSRYTCGELDIDMNGMGRHDYVAPVENVTWSVPRSITNGVYTVEVHNYNQRTKAGVGFDLQFEINGEVFNYFFKKGLPDGELIRCLEITYAEGKAEVKVLGGLESTTSSKQVWNVSTQQFHKVNMVMSSPNHWDGEQTGNKHLFFILEDCKNPESVRGFYNEFLSNELDEHRKVFEVLALKMKCKYNAQQLSGLGFSTTKRDEVICKVTSGSLSRLIKVKF